MAVIAEYPDFDGLALAALVKQGKIGPDDVIETVFHHLDRLNPSLNAIVRPMRAEAERLVRDGLPRGPFQGVPIVLKDEYLSYANVPNDHGSRLAAGWTRPYDTFLVQAYKRAGMMVVGKANLPELGASVTTDSAYNGRCNNPWNPERNTGGSSGGSAAAVAAGIVPIGYSNDGAGSIRIPASCCGAFGLKPTRARVSTAPDGGEYWNGLVIEHAITRSVRDSAAMLDLTDAPQPGDYYRAPPKERPFLEEVEREPGKLRIGMSAEPPFPAEVHADCVAAMENAAALCESLGHEVEEGTPEFDGPALAEGIGKLLCIHLAYGIDAMAEITRRRPSPDNVEAATWELARRGRELPATEMLDVLETFTATARRAAPWWERYDVWLTPTLAQPPLEHGVVYTGDPDADRYLRRWLEFVPFTPIANVTGNPAMSVPLHWNDEGLPIGSHFVAGFGREDLLYRLAGELERAAPWADRHPPVSAWQP